MKKTILLALLTAVLLSISSFAATPSASPSVSGALRVEGSRLCDRQGNPVQLRGISTHGLQWYPQYVTPETFRYFHENWNMNVVRLALYTESGGYCLQPPQGQEALKAVLRQGIQAATDNDMYVILDWHNLADGDPNTHVDEARDFFAEFSALYRDYTNILYEICNEPNRGTTWAEVRQYAEQIIPVIRANDPDAVIIVGTPHWSQYVDEAAYDPIIGYDNLMYAMHFYASTHGEELRVRMERALGLGLPVFVSECGISEADGNGIVDAHASSVWLDYLDLHGLSYLFWNLSNKAETSAVISADCGKLSGFTEEDLSLSGRWLYYRLNGWNTPEVPTQAGPAAIVYAAQQRTDAEVQPDTADPQQNNDAAASETRVIGYDPNMNHASGIYHRQ